MAETLVILFAALILDRLIGDPDWLWRRVPHPVVFFGKLIGWADTRFNDNGASETRREKNGFATIAVLMIGAIVAGTFLGDLFDALGGAGFVLEAVLVAVFLAQKSLADHGYDFAGPGRSIPLTAIPDPELQDIGHSSSPADEERMR